MRLLRPAAALALVLALSITPLSAAPDHGLTAVSTFGEVTQLAWDEFVGASEVDFDGRYAYVGHATLNPTTLQRVNVMNVDPDEGGLRIYDLEGEGDPDPETGLREGQFELVGHLQCPGTDNYVRWMDPEVFNPDEPDTQYIVMAFHGNQCTRDELLADPRSTNGHGARNGIMIVDVTDRTDPQIVDVIGHYSAHTVMPHPTRPYIYVLPGGTANGTDANRLAPTAIIDASDPTNLEYLGYFEHNAQGCHDLGWTIDGDYAYCAGIGEVQVWDVRDDKIESPVVVNTIVNPAIQFAHNAVVSPDGKYMLVNDEAFGFHTCTGESADLYGSLWIYDISIPDVPVLAGRISPPDHPDPDHRFGTLQNTPVQQGWAGSWCAAHNYNFVPGTNIVVASWFAGGMTAHDISNPLLPELIAGYQSTGDRGLGVMWSAHYYGGYVVTGDMRYGAEFLDVPALREAEEAASGTEEARSAGAPVSLVGLSTAGRRDLTDVLVPKVLPPRDPRPTYEAAFCTIPAIF